MLAFQCSNLVLELQDLVFVMLVCLLDIFLVLVHALLQLALILQIFRLLCQLLHVRQDDLHVEVVLIASLALVHLFRDHGGVPLASVRAVVPGVGGSAALLSLLLDLLRVLRRLLSLLVSELDLLLLLLLLVLLLLVMLLLILVHFLDDHRLLRLLITACLVSTDGVVGSSTGIGKLVARRGQLGMLGTAGDLLRLVPAMMRS